MHKFLLIIASIILVSCSTPKATTTIDNDDKINGLIALAPTILTQYQKTTCGLKTFRISNLNLKDSLTIFNISSVSIKYSHDTLNAEEFFYGNNNQLPDSCIIFGQDQINSKDRKTKSNLVFYFFGRTKPLNFRFATFEPLSERNLKINDSTWLYKSVHKLIGI